MITSTTQLRLKFYYDFVLGQVYAEGHSQYHQQVTNDVIRRFLDPLEIPRQARILDLGCGAGYFLREMRDRGYTDVIGITLSEQDQQLCQQQGHRVERRDMNLLSDRDESADVLWCRHSLEHSPFPYFSLIEYNRVLKPRGVLYIEVPQPDCDRGHESNANHYSVLGRAMWLSLLQRTGFDVAWHDYELPVKLDTGQQVVERYHIFVCRRCRAMDIK